MTNPVQSSPAQASPTAPRLKLEGLTKRFPGVLALDGVSLEVARGEVHAVCGENGAGKSTLVKLVAGVYSPDGGTLELDGVRLSHLTERRAGALGIGMVHQEGSLVPQLSVAENAFAGRAPLGYLGQVDRRRMEAQTAELLEQLSVGIDPRRRVADLSAAEKQAVEIVKALSQDLRLLILDEPTAALTVNETDKLFALVRVLVTRGVSVLYISHRLAEIFELCEQVTVLKDGRLSGTRPVAATTKDELIHLMVGREVTLERQNSAAVGEAVLEVKHLSSGAAVVNASLTVRAGEIVCLAGLIGAGRSETCEAIFGVRPFTGRVRFLGREVRFRHPAQAIGAGIGMVPEDRKEAGLFLEMSVMDNLSVAALEQVSQGLSISNAKNRVLAQRFVERLRIVTPGLQQKVGHLSGGNQQKVLLAKWLTREPKLLIVDEPTRGVDVGARAEIYRILRELRSQGVALLIVSSDLPEVLALADRIVVMNEGRTVGELEGAGADELDILRLAAQAGVATPLVARAEVKHV